MSLRIFFVTCLLAAGMVACSTPDETSPSGEKQVTADELRHVKVYFEKGTGSFHAVLLTSTPL